MGSLDELRSGKTSFAKANYPPVLKDTILIPIQGFVKIKVRTSNPGYWMFHCHIDNHFTPGMGLIMKVGDKEDMRSPPPNFPTCGNYLVPVF